jgi:tRNA/rRNA methyltransferase
VGKSDFFLCLGIIFNNQHGVININMEKLINNPQLNSIKIILVEPAGELNIGSVARIMKNMGLSQLVLVNPQGDRLSHDAKLMAVHAIDILENAQVTATIPEALQGCTRAIATTARTRNLPTTLEQPRMALPWLVETNAPTALIFGSEERGLSNEELNYAQRFVSIPSNPEYPSLNLAQAVALCCYELSQAILIDHTTSEDLHRNISPSETTTLDLLEGYYQHLERVLLKIGYLYPHTAKSRMEKFRRLYNRANLNHEEVAMLRGILRQVEFMTND